MSVESGSRFEIGPCNLDTFPQQKTIFSRRTSVPAFSLNPSAIAVASGRSAEVVECEDLKPCCVGCVGRADLRRGNRSRSRTLAAGERREIGR